MGLDITYYDRFQIVEGGDAEEDERLIELWGREFPLQAEGLDGKVVLADGAGSFRAGAYGGYNEWRNLLCRAVNGFPAQELWRIRGSDLERLVDYEKDRYPFEELINFSDCEGVIGPKTCARLAEDFKLHREKVLNAAMNVYFMQKYDEWAEAFRTAAHHGFVRFH